MKKKLMSLLLVASMVVGLVPQTVHASNDVVYQGLCEHHAFHDNSCGYSQEVIDINCSHTTHDDSCYLSDTEPKQLMCQHSHDDTCIFTVVSEGNDCQYVCKLCPIQALISTIPSADSINDANKDSVIALLEEIDSMKSSLSDEEISRINFTNYQNAVGALSGASNEPTVVPEVAVISADTVYTNFSGGSAELGLGTEESPFNYFKDALAAVNAGGTIIVGSNGAYIDAEHGVDGDIMPYVINKNVTIRSDSSSYINVRPAGIILGADVTFENVQISLVNTEKNAIFANGHTLVLTNSGMSSGAKTVNIYGGGVSGSSASTGSSANIVINGVATSFGDICAGGYNSDFNGSTTVTIRNTEYNEIGSVSAIGVSGSVNINLENAGITTVIGANKAIVTIDTAYLKDNISLSDIDTLIVNSGEVKPVFINPTAKAVIGGTLDLSFFTNIGAITGNNGTLRLGKDTTLAIAGDFTGNLTFETGDQKIGSESGLLKESHTYITVGGSNDATVSFTPNTNQTSIQFVKEGSSWKSTVSAGSEPTEEYKVIDFEITLDNTDYARANYTTELDLDVTYETTVDTQGDWGNLEWFPLEYQVVYNGNTYTADLDYDVDGNFNYGYIDDLDMRFFPFGDDNSTGLLSIAFDEMPKAGSYTIKVSVPSSKTQSGSVLEDSIVLNITGVAPSKPKNLQATNIASNNVTLSWVEPDDLGGYASVSYVVYVDGVKFDEDLTETSYTVTNLDASTQYTLGVSAKNDIGSSDLISLDVTTLDESIPQKAEKPGNNAVAYNHHNETVSILSTVEVNTKQDFTGTEIANNSSISDYIGKTIYARTKATSTVLASDVVSFDVPARPVVDIDSLELRFRDNKVIIVNANEFSNCEFSTDGLAWQTESEFSNLDGQTCTVYVRVRATNSSFRSEAKTKTISLILSSDTTVTSCKVNGLDCSFANNVFSVVLPYGSDIPTDVNALSIITADGATYNMPVTVDNGKTWVFSVTAEDEVTTKTYTINVSVAEDPKYNNIAMINAAKLLLENKDFSVRQEVANTKEELEDYLKERVVSLLNNNKIKVEVVVNGVVPAVAGTATNVDGTNGKFNVTIDLTTGVLDNNPALNTFVEDSLTLNDIEITATKHTHNYINEFKYDKTNHWVECACGDKANVGVHRGGSADSKGDVKCITCGYLISSASDHKHDWGDWKSNGDGTHSRKCKHDNSHKETKNCSGGEASCKSKAVCSVCKAEYGSKDKNNHKGGTELKNYLAESETRNGYSGDVYCLGCKKLIKEGEIIPKIGDKPSDKVTETTKVELVNEEYTIVRGDTLSKIAKKYGCTVDEIMALNSGLIKNKNFIRVGWIIKLPKMVEKVVSTTNTGNAGNSVSTKTDTYTVKSGDTLWKISRNYGCSISKLVELNANQISNPNLIRIGWVLVVPTH